MIADRPLRVIVCGTTFGQIYLQALASPGPFRLAGILAQGSARSRACAERFGVPLFTDAGALPAEIDVACVVVRSGAMGGRGTELARQLMDRGIHVLQEHPVHHDELAQCLAHAHRRGVVYHLNAFYTHLPPVRRFLSATRALLRRQRPVFVDAACAIQVAYPMFDLLAQAVGALRPFALTELPAPADGEAPFRSLTGQIGGVPLTLRIGNRVDPADPDNHLPLLHRLTLGTEAGDLTLINTHGPCWWSPRFFVPAALKDRFEAEGLPGDSGTALGPASAPSFQEIFGSLWPAAVRQALSELRQAILRGEDPRGRGQYHLGLCRLWQEATSRIGYPQLVRGEPAPALPLAELAAAIEETPEVAWS